MKDTAFLFCSDNQVSVRTMMLISNRVATASVSSNLLAMDLTFANKREGRWFLSNVPIKSV